MSSRPVVGLALAGLLLARLPSAAASEREAPICGYRIEGALVERTDHGVPVLLHSTAFATQVAELGAAQRLRHRDEETASRTRCPLANAYLSTIIERLVQGSELGTFARTVPAIRVVLQCSRQHELPVAKAGPGNLLLVPGALLARAASEDAIAAVLAHELAHLTLRHAERFAAASPRSLAPDLRRALKRAHEREADVTGLRILVRAGYDPRAAIDHLRMVDAMAHGRRRGSLARAGRRAPVHDDAEARVLRLERQIAACGYGAARPRAVVAPGVRREASEVSAGFPRRGDGQIPSDPDVPAASSL